MRIEGPIFIMVETMGPNPEVTGTGAKAGIIQTHTTKHRVPNRNTVRGPRAPSKLQK